MKHAISVILFTLISTTASAGLVELSTGESVTVGSTKVTCNVESTPVDPNPDSYCTCVHTNWKDQWDLRMVYSDGTGYVPLMSGLPSEATCLFHLERDSRCD